MASIIPPQFVYAPVELVYGDLPRAVVLTGLRVWGLGWRNGYRCAGPVSEDELVELCRVKRSTLYGHLARLITLGVLRYTSTGGEFTFHFNKPVPSAPPRSPENWTSPENRTAIVAVGGSSSPSSNLKREERKDQQQQQHNTLTGGECEGGAEPSDFLDRLVILGELGINGRVRKELAGLWWASATYLERWLDWSRMDPRSIGLGAGYYVEQIRDGEHAPVIRFGPADDSIIAG